MYLWIQAPLFVLFWDISSLPSVLRHIFVDCSIFFFWFFFHQAFYMVTNCSILRNDFPESKLVQKIFPSFLGLEVFKPEHFREYEFLHSVKVSKFSIAQTLEKWHFGLKEIIGIWRRRNTRRKAFNSRSNRMNSLV